MRISELLNITESHSHIMVEENYKKKKQIAKINYLHSRSEKETFLHLTALSIVNIMGRDSSVGIATRYGLDGPGNRIPVGARFSAPVQTCPGVYPASCTIRTASFPRDKPAGAWCRPTIFSAEVLNWVQQYLYPPYGP